MENPGLQIGRQGDPKHSPRVEITENGLGAEGFLGISALNDTVGAELVCLELRILEPCLSHLRFKISSVASTQRPSRPLTGLGG